ncbi:hypothetical protein BK010_09465 [Tenericutes bacterium MO-XQ]|nr:hypothetical protein BK010_09465 [Tenericutes bacterium MO-XQ]
MKKLSILLVVFLFAVALTACSAKEKEFSGAGITVTLDESFVEKEVVQAPLYLESFDYIFTGLRESSSELIGYGIGNLEDYIDAVLSNNNHESSTVETMTDDDNNVLYYYAYYTATVEDMEFAYMLVTMQGESHYYTMNFGCLESNLDDSKDQFFTWAESITVD